MAHQAFPRRIAAVTVDHGLRTEAAEEARFVAAICSERGIAHTILHPAEPITGNIQSSARAARYALLSQWADDAGCAFIATAHHADDQLETILMRLARGSGVDGLAGVRAVNGRIIRPLLDFTKSELLNICRAAGISPADDPSNHNADFDRVRMRNWLSRSYNAPDTPASPHPLDPVAANRSAGALAGASAALDWTAQYFAEQRITANTPNYALDPQGLPRELVRRLVLIIVQAIAPETKPRGDAVERVLDALIAGDKVTLGNIQCIGGTIWHFGPAPPRSSA